MSPAEGDPAEAAEAEPAAPDDDALDRLESGQVEAQTGGQDSEPAPAAGSPAAHADQGARQAAAARDAAGAAQRLASEASDSRDPERAREAAEQAGAAASKAEAAGERAEEVMRGSFGSERTPIASVRDSAWRWIRAAAIVLTLFTTYQLLVVARGIVADVLNVVLLLVFGAIVALLVQPLVEVLESRLRLPRTAAVLGGLLGAVALLGLLGFLLAAPLAAEAHSLSTAVPGLLRRASAALSGARSYADAHGVALGTGGLPGGNSSRLTASLSVLLSGVSGGVQAAVDVLITLVVAFWLLRDGAALRAGMLSILPSRLSSEVEFGLDAGRAVVGGYVRAQVALAALVGGLAGLGCFVLGVPFPLVVGLAAGVFELVPLVGALIGGLVAVLLALTISPGLALATVALFVGIHIVEGYGIAPRVQARFVRLHPLVALLALLTGVEVGGFLGALFAIPVASLFAVFLRAAIGDWRAQRPEVFAPQRRDHFLEGRRRRLLREFRLFRRPS